MTVKEHKSRTENLVNLQLEMLCDGIAEVKDIACCAVSMIKLQQATAEGSLTPVSSPEQGKAPEVCPASSTPGRIVHVLEATKFHCRVHLMRQSKDEEVKPFKFTIEKYSIRMKMVHCSPVLN